MYSKLKFHLFVWVTIGLDSLNIQKSDKKEHSIKNNQ